MRRLARHLLTLCAAVSFVLCIAAGVAWALSYGDRKRALNPAPARVPGPAVESARGRLRVVVPMGREAVPAAAAIPFPPKTFTSPGDASNWSVGGTVTRGLPGGGKIITRNLRLDETADWRSFHAWSVEEVGPTARFAWCTWDTGRASDGPVDVDTRDPARSAAAFRRWGALTVPHAYVLIAAAVLPAVWGTRAARRARRQRHGHCANCGYDLRASPDRCPECGASPGADGRTDVIVHA